MNRHPDPDELGVAVPAEREANRQERRPPRSREDQPFRHRERSEGFPGAAASFVRLRRESERFLGFASARRVGWAARLHIDQPDSGSLHCVPLEPPWFAVMPKPPLLPKRERGLGVRAGVGCRNCSVALPRGSHPLSLEWHTRERKGGVASPLPCRPHDRLSNSFRPIRPVVGGRA